MGNARTKSPRRVAGQLDDERARRQATVACVGYIPQAMQGLVCLPVSVLASSERGLPEQGLRFEVV